MHGRSTLATRRPLTRKSQLTSASVACLLVVLTGCSSAGSKQAPDPSPSSVTPSASPTAGPKPGGTLRIAGVARSVDLDPASADSTQNPGSGLQALASVSRADGDRLVGRLVLRQLYGYQPTDPELAAASADTAPGPSPDLASGEPKLTNGGRTATITLRTARWDVPSGRRVTANDEVRALKRLCLPGVSSPVRGYLTESVEGYAAGCAALARRPPATLSALDAVTIRGLSTEGDTTLVLQLLRPTNDLTAILSMPETSPLPVESFDGTKVTTDAQRFVGDGPYRFVETQGSETYALSRSPSWDPASDPLRRAYVDHVSIRGGMTAAKVLSLVSTGGADLSLDVPLPPATAAQAVVATPAQADVLLTVGARGAAAAQLRSPRFRRVVAGCIDTSLRTKIAAALGTGIASASDDLLAGMSLLPTGERSFVPATSPASTAPSGAVTPTSSDSLTPSPTPTPTPKPSVTPSPSARCVPTLGVSGASLTLLTLDNPRTRAAATLVVLGLERAGIRVTLQVAGTQQYVLRSRTGGWDLMIALRPVRYPAPRSVLAPLLDAGWPGTDAIAVLRSTVYAGQMLAANAQRESAASVQAWQSLSNTIANASVIIPLAQLSAVYPRGSNLANAPITPTLANADPTNVALGSTRPGDPSQGATPTP